VAFSLIAVDFFLLKMGKLSVPPAILKIKQNGKSFFTLFDWLIGVQLQSETAKNTLV
jgi:hypothetical protein